MKHKKPVNKRAVVKTADTPKLLMPVAMSLIGHLILFVVFISGPRINFHRDAPQRIINVNLVSLPSPAPVKNIPTPAKPAVAKVKPPAQKKATKKTPIKTTPAPLKKKAISLAPKKKPPKVSLKKKTFKASKVVATAVKRIQKEAKESRPDPVKDAIERMRSAVRDKEAAGTRAVSGAGGEAGKKRALALLDIYRVEIAHYIQKNWAYSEQMAEGRKNLTAWVMIEVNRNGTIREFWFEKRSGSTYLDDSAAKAIQKANPLPPFPEGVTRSSIHQGFRFTPAGVQ